MHFFHECLVIHSCIVCHMLLKRFIWWIGTIADISWRYDCWPRGICADGSGAAGCALHLRRRGSRVKSSCEYPWSRYNKTGLLRHWRAISLRFCRSAVDQNRWILPLHQLDVRLNLMRRGNCNNVDRIICSWPINQYQYLKKSSMVMHVAGSNIKSHFMVLPAMILLNEYN